MTEKGNAERTLARTGAREIGDDSGKAWICVKALCRVEERTAEPGILCIVEVGRFVELALCGRVEAYQPSHPRAARACASTSSPGMVSTSPATMAS
jgi:hypothetical protein